MLTTANRTPQDAVQQCRCPGSGEQRKTARLSNDYCLYDEQQRSLGAFKGLAEAPVLERNAPTVLLRPTN
jgi:hypothetical protein